MNTRIIEVVSEHSAWQFGWETIVALGTLLLAGATFYLGVTTRSLAKRTNDEIEIANKALAAAQEQTAAIHLQAGVASNTLAASFRPTLIHLTPDWHGDRAVTWNADNGAVHIRVGVRNVGAGFAFLGGGKIWSADNERSEVEAILTESIVLVGEYTYLHFQFNAQQDKGRAFTYGVEQTNAFDCEVTYVDLGGNPWVTTFKVTRSQNLFHVLQTEIAADDHEGEGVVGGRMIVLR